MPSYQVFVECNTANRGRYNVLNTPHAVTMVGLFSAASVSLQFPLLAQWCKLEKKLNLEGLCCVCDTIWASAQFQAQNTRRLLRSFFFFKPPNLVIVIQYLFLTQNLDSLSDTVAHVPESLSVVVTLPLLHNNL